jgi:hypothetical protein
VTTELAASWAVATVRTQLCAAGCMTRRTSDTMSSDMTARTHVGWRRPLQARQCQNCDVSVARMCLWSLRRCSTGHVPHGFSHSWYQGHGGATLQSTSESQRVVASHKRVGADRELSEDCLPRRHHSSAGCTAAERNAGLPSTWCLVTTGGNRAQCQECVKERASPGI